MSFGILFANPVVLAIVTVAAIGVITYQILNDERRMPTRGRGGPGCRGGPGGRCGDGGPYKPDKPDEGPGGFSISIGHSNEEHSKCCNEPKSETSKSVTEVRRRNTGTPNPPENSKVSCNESKSHPVSFSNAMDRNLELSSDSSTNPKSQNPALQNKETEKVVNNISLSNSNKTFVANIKEDDSDSSESNNLHVNSDNTIVANEDDGDSDSLSGDSSSGNSDSSSEDSDSSSESNNSFYNLNKSMDLNESIHSIASCSTATSNNIGSPSPMNNSEEIYKRDVCSYLKTDIYKKNGQEICFNNFSDEESVSESNFSVTSKGSNTSCSSRKKPDLCKGCLEEIANAVAYPCKHCYLCLDCAVKVHRIFKKCTICSSVIKTFEQF